LLVLDNHLQQPLAKPGRFLARSKRGFHLGGGWTVRIPALVSRGSSVHQVFSSGTENNEPRRAMTPLRQADRGFLTSASSRNGTATSQLFIATGKILAVVVESFQSPQLRPESILRQLSESQSCRKTRQMHRRVPSLIQHVER